VAPALDVVGSVPHFFRSKSETFSNPEKGDYGMSDLVFGLVSIVVGVAASYGVFWLAALSSFPAA
jgi:hypothetical protein